ncbi:DinB family protein [Chryseobacterium sp. SNU WT5]|uniref:DinB family protein n=1 Tax=Chryseobacterium sp. SNU WT5 TaxID=2594269 RepID=UPI00117F53AE|nr:DinB family protein [Chryseobacterium sp. SNU WT5]QDP84394.1 DinB family protein [Chryseobacterium sp. SNU WT5]
MDSTFLLEEIIRSTHSNILTAEDLRKKSNLELNRKHNAECWSVLECLEHLNLYSDFYLPEIAKVISGSNSTFNRKFKSGLIGGYFVKSMSPREQLNKMKTSKDKNPINSKIDKSAIDRFISNQYKFLSLLESSKNIDLNKVKTKISITRLIKIKLGDTLMFLNNHTLRHLMQIERILINH